MLPLCNCTSHLDVAGFSLIEMVGTQDFPSCFYKFLTTLSLVNQMCYLLFTGITWFFCSVFLAFQSKVNHFFFFNLLNPFA